MRKILIALVLVALPLAATTITPMSVERLTQASTHVVMGQAAESWSQWNPEHTQIFTYTRFRVTKSLKGSASNTVVVKQMGGRAGGYEQKVAGVRELQSGERAVLFMHPSQSADGTLVVTGLMQGNFRVMESAKGQATVSNGVIGVNQYHAESGTIGHYSGTHMPLSQLETLVRSAQRSRQ
jgi:hypothetical protein